MTWTTEALIAQLQEQEAHWRGKTKGALKRTLAGYVGSGQLSLEHAVKADALAEAIQRIEASERDAHDKRESAMQGIASLQIAVNDLKEFVYGRSKRHPSETGAVNYTTSPDK